MCRAVTCTTCGKTTWAGCGQHVDQVMKNVPAAQRCGGHEAGTPGSKVDAPGSRGFFARLLGR
ncbi:hypothetical protein [Brachybacterium aquaticum]|uniref:Uncharacterized protein n=1 Tax=Brachybacterium aquaticum TaxID=1432564 RepID=A0A841ACJ6_9MICO|nr:hypothetical protein [Brachybacterium aquaticum]MBB5832556.1 hypothetical protein [Brachybacterium aquaticum]